MHDGQLESWSQGSEYHCAGTYLPLTAVLDGSLFVRPEGYREASRDVIRLSPSITELRRQVHFP